MKEEEKSYIHNKCIHTNLKKYKSAEIYIKLDTQRNCSEGKLINRTPHWKIILAGQLKTRRQKYNSRNAITIIQKVSRKCCPNLKPEKLWCKVSLAKFLYYLSFTSETIMLCRTQRQPVRIGTAAGRTRWDSRKTKNTKLLKLQLGLLQCYS